VADRNWTAINVERPTVKFNIGERSPRNAVLLQKLTQQFSIMLFID